MDGGFTLRDYQRDAAEEALRRNLLVVLPTNSGKTVIAADVVFHMLLEHPEKKAIFVAPKRTLAMQQARLLLRHIGPLHLRTDHWSNQRRNEPRWRLAVAASVNSLLAEDEGDGLDMVVHWRHAFDEAQCIVTTAELFDRALTHRSVAMSNVSLLVLDEVHQLRGQSHYMSIMNYFYRLAPTRPRVLGLTASPIEKPEASAPDAVVVKRALQDLQTNLDARVWSRRVEFGQFETRVVEFDDISPAAPLRPSLLKIQSAVESARPWRADGDEELRRGWDECIAKVCKVGTELGDWAAMRAARMLAEDLRSGLTKLETLEKNWFARDDDSEEGGGDEAAADAASSAVWRASKRRKERLVHASDEEAERAKLRVLKAAGDALLTALDHLPATAALTTMSDKVRALCKELGERQPQSASSSRGDASAVASWRQCSKSSRATPRTLSTGGQLDGSCRSARWGWRRGARVSAWASMRRRRVSLTSVRACGYSSRRASLRRASTCPNATPSSRLITPSRAASCSSAAGGRGRRTLRT